MFGAKRVPARGKSIKSEEETEPSRILKLKECCDMLVVGGYFRARIPTLSPFDKVVGGMVWSITASAVEVDVDILFQENSTIGERIRLSEQIVRALISMKCPRAIQPQQIQGLDYDQLFPVIQWLIRIVIETRLLMGDEVRLLSLSQFDKTYTFPGDVSPPEAKDFVANVKENYRPIRQFKQSQQAKFDSLSAQTTATLLEYGEKIFGRSFEDEEAADEKERRKQNRGGGKGLVSSLTKKDELEDQKRKDAEEKKRKEIEEGEQKKIDELKASLSTADGQGVVGGKSVASLVEMSADTIRSSLAEYEEKKKEEEGKEGPAGSGKGSAAQAHQRQVVALKRKMAALEKKISGKMQLYKELSMKAKLSRVKQKKKETYRDKILRETAKLTELENEASNKEILTKLKSFVILNETLKTQETQFKANCKRERAELLDLLRRLEAGDTDEVETKRMKEVERIYETDLEKLNKIRAGLAKKNQEIARINRLIDEIPTRAELLQYERRFIELYELVAEKLVETRKYYAMYNTLDESYQFMQQEVKLLNSVVDGFPNAMKTKGGRENFLAQFQKILEGIDKQKEQVEKEYQREKGDLDVLKDKYAQLLEKQRNYFKAVKEFQEECVKNEKYAVALERASAKGKKEEE